MKNSAKTSLTQKTFRSMKVVERTMSNKCIFVSIIIVSALLFAAVLMFNALAGNPNLIKGGPFHHSIGNISAMYPLRITPAGWAFSIWGVIYLLQFGSTLYSLGLLCRTTMSEQPAYCNPAILSPVYFVLISLNWALNIGWLFLWDRMLFTASMVFLLVTTVSLFSALTIVSTRLVFYRTDLIDTGRKLDVKIIHAVIMNGLGMYATWSTIATLINFGVALVYKWHLNLSDEKMSLICLCILFILVLKYSVLDLTVLDRYTRSILTPYVTVIWALSAVIDKNWDASQWSSIMSAIILAVASVLFVVKVALGIYRQNKVNNPYRRLNIGGPMIMRKANGAN